MGKHCIIFKQRSNFTNLCFSKRNLLSVFQEKSERKLGNQLGESICKRDKEFLWQKAKLGKDVGNIVGVE